MVNVIQFPHATSPVQPIAHFIRLGESGYHKLEALHAVGRLPASRAVVDASRALNQKELMAALRADGAELVLDPKVAELSAREKFQGVAAKTPWAMVGNGAPLAPSHFRADAVGDIFGRIARFAVAQGFHTVLAPTHFLGDPDFEGWLAIDIDACFALRRALDREGGTNIAIDYPVIASHLMLAESGFRSDLMHRLADAPFDNLWIRASGFGNNASPLATKRFIASMGAFHNLGKPIVGDYLGGMVAEAALAFGAVAGISHGIGERERFDASTWHKPPKERDEDTKFGRAVRVLIPGLDRSATKNELELLMKARGAHRLIACNNRACCPHGARDMLNEPRQHAAFQCFEMVDQLAEIPDLNREDHFLRRIEAVERKARDVTALKLSSEDARALGVDAEGLTKRLGKHSHHLSNQRRGLEALHEARGKGAPRSRPVANRLKLNAIQRTKKK